MPAGHSRVSSDPWRAAARPGHGFSATAGVLSYRNGYPSAHGERLAWSRGRHRRGGTRGRVHDADRLPVEGDRTRRSRSASCTCWLCCSSRRSGARGSGSRRPSRARSRSTSSTSSRPGASRSPTASTGSRWRVFFVAALVASELAQRARQQAQQADERRREADLSAEMARLLLRADDLRRGAGGGRSPDREHARPPVGRGRDAGRRRRLPAARVPAARGLAPARHAARAGRPAGGDACAPAGTRRAIAGGAAGRSDRARRAALQPRRGRGPAPHRRAEDRAPAGCLARPALAADRDPERRRAAAERVDHRGGAQRAGVRHHPGGAAAVAADRQPARPVAARGRRRGAAARLVRPARGDPLRGGGARPARRHVPACSSRRSCR